MSDRARRKDRRREVVEDADEDSFCSATAPWERYMRAVTPREESRKM